MIARFVEQWKLRGLWHHVSGLFAKGSKVLAGYYAPEDLLEGLENGSMQLGVVYDEDAKAFKAIVITHPVTTPQVRTMRVMMLAGEDMDDIVAAEDELINHAIAHECDDVSAITREGVARALTKRGWERVGVLVRKTIVPDGTVH